MDAEKITELETKILYHEDHIQELNKAVFGLQKQFERLESDYELAKNRLRELEKNQGIDIDPNETPPHY